MPTTMPSPRPAIRRYFQSLAQPEAWDASLEGYEPSRYWHSDPATGPQLECLRRSGYEPPDDCTKGEAWFVLSRPTIKMRRLLEDYGRWHDTMTFDEARDAIGAIANEEGGRPRQKEADDD
jgi:hypothetical protein